MPLLSLSTLFTVLAVVLVLVLAVLAYIKWRLSYFKYHNLPHIPSKSIFGREDNSLQQRRTAMGDKIRQTYDEFKAKKQRYCGVYFVLRPMLFINDLNLLKLVLTKDFDHFVDRGMYFNERDDPLSANLFALGGTEWRNLRVKLTPTFTSGKMKMMFGTLQECGVYLREFMDTKQVTGEPIDIKDVLGCFTTDIIGSCAFGLECNSFKEPNSPFRVYSKKVLTGTLWKRMVMDSLPGVAKLMRLTQTPEDVTEFFMKIVKEAIDYREANNIKRKDLLQLLINIGHNQGDGDEKLAKSGDNNLIKPLTLKQLTAESLLFFMAGFETSSTLMTFTLYELAKNQDLQDKVRREIVEVLKKHDGQITYDSIMDLKYMNQVLDEALRKYPPVPFITRECVKDYTPPNDDGTKTIIIRKGLRIGVPIFGIHYDPDYYPDPEKFDPDRFSEKNKQSRHQYAFLSFGEGPRICIGMRFGLMQAKVGVTTILRHFKIFVNPKTQQPLKLDPKSFITSADGGIWLDVEKL